jgi:hypothetical protein
VGEGFWGKKHEGTFFKKSSLILPQKILTWMKDRMGQVVPFNIKVF